MKLKIGDKLIFKLKYLDDSKRWSCQEAIDIFKNLNLNKQIFIVTEVDLEYRDDKNYCIKTNMTNDIKFWIGYFHKLTKQEIRKLEGFDQELENLINEL